jgi:CHAD domain-containing protein
MNRSQPVELRAHVTESVKKMRRRYRRRLARCQEKFSEKSVHDLRIETRRVLALVDLLRALQVRDSLKKMRKVFKQRLDTFDQLRDTQVQLLLLKPLWQDFPEARAFDQELRQHEELLIAELRHEIKGTKLHHLEQRMKDLEKQLRKSAKIGEPPMRKAQAAAALSAAFASVVQLHRRIRPNRPETIHRMRVMFKRFRYMSELLSPVFPRLTPEWLREMQKYQKLMGEIQDHVVLLAGMKQAVLKARLATGEARGLQRELIDRREALILAFMAKAGQLFEFQPEKFTRLRQSAKMIDE